MRTPQPSPWYVSLYTVSLQGVAALALLAVLASWNPLLAQTDEEEEDPKEETITLTTSDGVQLQCTYFRGEDGRNSIPVILIHGEGGDRGQFDSLARYLQATNKCAVIVPDLRKHGGSTRQKNIRINEMVDLKKKLTREDVLHMTHFDIKACKKHLVMKNNEAKLNIDRLCVLGAEEGCIVAMNYSVNDWSAQQLAGFRQGRDVKAVIFVSPTINFRGVTMLEALRHPATPFFSVLLTAGSRTAKMASTVNRMKKQFDTLQIRATKNGQAIYAKLPSTSLQGTAMLNKKLNTEALISQFINKHLNKMEDHKWADRKSPQE